MMKKLSVIFLLIGLLAVAAYVYMRLAIRTPKFQPLPSKDAAAAPKPAESMLDIRPRLIEKIQELVKTGSNGLYNISMHEIEPDIVRSQLKIYKVELAPDTTVLREMDRRHITPDDVFKITANNIAIEGIGIKDVLSKKNIDLKNILIANPTIEIYHHKRTWNRAKDSLTLYQRLTQHMQHLSVNNIMIRNGTVISHHIQKNKTSRFNNIDISLSDILVDSSTQYDKHRFLFARHANLSMKNFEETTADNLYTIHISDISVSATEQTAIAKNILLQPKYSKEAFGKKAGVMKERYTFSAPSIQLKNLSWQKLLQQEQLEADEVHLSGGKFGIYLDRSLPEGKPKTNSFPSQLLMQLPMQIHIAKLKVSGLDVTYEEFNPASGQTGKLYADNLHGEISNLTNTSSSINQNHITRVHAVGTLMKGMPAELELSFDLLRYREGAFTAGVHIKNIEAGIINPVAEPLGMFRVKRGSGKELTATISGNNASASGKVLLLYNDLHVIPLEKDNRKPNQLEKKNTTSFIANTFFIKNENPSGSKAPRNPDCSFIRDVHCSFFNLLWKTTFVGILKTIGAPEKIAYKKASGK